MSSLIKAPAAPVDQGAVVTGIPWTVSPSPGLGIVLTNRCDFLNGKVGYLIAAGMVPAKDVLQGSSEFQQIVGEAESDVPLSGKKWEKLQRFLDPKIFNQHIGRYFLLEASDLSLGPMLVDFQLLTSVPFGEDCAATVVGRVDSPDREHLVTRFAAYSMRIGVSRLAGNALDSVRADLAAPWHGP